MWEKVYLAFVVAMIGGTILSIREVDAQSTVDDSASCESSTMDETLNLIRDYLKDAKAAFNALSQRQNAAFSALTEQQNNMSAIFKKELEELKAANCSSDSST